MTVTTVDLTALAADAITQARRSTAAGVSSTAMRLLHQQLGIDLRRARHAVDRVLAAEQQTAADQVTAVAEDAFILALDTGSTVTAATWAAVKAVKDQVGCGEALNIAQRLRVDHDNWQARRQQKTDSPAGTSWRQAHHTRLVEYRQGGTTGRPVVVLHERGCDGHGCGHRCVSDPVLGDEVRRAWDANGRMDVAIWSALQRIA